MQTTGYLARRLVGNFFALVVTGVIGASQEDAQWFALLMFAAFMFMINIIDDVDILYHAWRNME